MGRYELINPLSLFNELDRSFGQFFNDSERVVTRNLNPITNVREEKDYFELSLDVPGIKKEDLNVELKDNVLSIKGERKAKTSDENGNFASLGNFERNFSLPKDIDLEQIEVTHTDGVLEVILPKVQRKVEAKTIKIKTAEQKTIAN